MVYEVTSYARSLGYDEIAHLLESHLHRSIEEQQSRAAAYRQGE